MSNYESGPPPLANVETEAALLGACMMDNTVIGRFGHILDPGDFFEPLHGRIWRALRKFADRGKTANPVTLKPMFEMDPAMAELGGPISYLSSLTGSGAALVGVADFAEQIRDLARMRDVRDAVWKGLDAIEEEASLEAFLSHIEVATSRASATVREIPLFSTEDMVGLARDRATKTTEQGVQGASCKTIKDLDTLIGRLEGGQMTILAGRPGMGKSTTAMSAALGYAVNGHPGLYALAESSAEMFSLKLTADLLHLARRPIAFRTLREAILSKGELRNLDEAAEVAKSLPIKFAHVGRTDIRRLEAIVAREANRLKREGRRLEWFVVDYLQLLTAEGRHKAGDDRGRVNAVSEGLLGIAQKHDTHCIALSQLSRAVEARDDKRPRLSDLRESGRLEEDADNVLMVYREEYYLEKAKPTAIKDLEAWEIEMGHARGKVEILAVKTRFGSNSVRKAHFFGDYSAVRGSDYHSNASQYDEEDDLFKQFGRGQ